MMYRCNHILKQVWQDGRLKKQPELQDKFKDSSSCISKTRIEAKG